MVSIALVADFIVLVAVLDELSVVEVVVVDRVVAAGF